jgi:hypothetical protein
MSRAKLKEEGHKAIHKGDYNAALEFYTMVCYCTFCGCLICIHWTGLHHYQMFFWMLVQTIHGYIFIRSYLPTLLMLYF